jgi:hypothetical protein
MAFSHVPIVAKKQPFLGTKGHRPAIDSIAPTASGG